MVRLVRARPEDAEVLAQVSKRAFDDDVSVGAPGPGGPPGYDLPGWQATMMRRAEAYYKLVREGQIVGGAIVFRPGPGHYHLGRIFVEPALHRRGIGTQACELLWREYPLARRWTLETPAWNRRTQAFYEKLGFVRVGESAEGIHYERTLRRATPR